MINQADILGSKILIVDDLDANVRLLQQMLLGVGYTCTESTTKPQEVAALHTKNRYDLILLDLQMPGMDGFQVLEQLKVIEADSYAPVLVITAQPGHKQRALQSGAKDFVSKPFDLAEVKTRIHNMLEVRLLYKQLANQHQVLEQTVLTRTAELRASEARLLRFAELSSDWYWEQDINGEFTAMSGPALEMLGIQHHSVARTNDAQAPRWNETERATLEENIAARRPFLDFIYSRINVDGSQQYFQVSGEPIFDSSGCYTGYRGIGMDITERMQRNRVESIEISN